jgi:hypothetical protein
MMYEKMMNRFLELDNDTELPFTLRLFMLLSPGYRREVNNLREQIKALRKEAPFVMPCDMSPEIMESILVLAIRHDYGVSSLKWLFVGIVIWLSIILFSFSDSLIPMADYFGAHLLVPINIVLGLGISIYAAIYMASHVEVIKKSLNGSFKFFIR